MNYSDLKMLRKLTVKEEEIFYKSSTGITDSKVSLKNIPLKYLKNKGDTYKYFINLIDDLAVNSFLFEETIKNIAKEFNISEASIVIINGYFYSKK